MAKGRYSTRFEIFLMPVVRDVFFFLFSSIWRQLLGMPIVALSVIRRLLLRWIHLVPLLVRQPLLRVQYVVYVVANSSAHRSSLAIVPHSPIPTPSPSLTSILVPARKRILCDARDLHRWPFAQDSSSLRERFGAIVYNTCYLYLSVNVLSHGGQIDGYRLGQRWE